MMDLTKKPLKESESKSMNVNVEVVNTSVEPFKTSAEPSKTSVEPSKSNEPLKKPSNQAETNPLIETAFENTLSFQEAMETEPGEFTDNLSDVSNDERFDGDHLRQRSIFVRYLRRIFPHFRNNLTLFLFIVNVLLVVAIIAFLVVDMTLLKYYLEFRQNLDELENKEQFCIYSWSEWGPCSGTCRQNSTVPFRTRKVLNYTEGDKKHKCPEDILNWQDYSPCNIIRCPMPLSSFGWTICNNDIKMRDLPMNDQLIQIDGGNLYQKC